MVRHHCRTESTQFPLDGSMIRVMEAGKRPDPMPSILSFNLLLCCGSLAIAVSCPSDCYPPVIFEIKLCHKVHGTGQTRWFPITPIPITSVANASGEGGLLSAEKATKLHMLPQMATS